MNEGGGRPACNSGLITGPCCAALLVSPLAVMHTRLCAALTDDATCQDIAFCASSTETLRWLPAVSHWRYAGQGQLGWRDFICCALAGRRHPPEINLAGRLGAGTSSNTRPGFRHRLRGMGSSEIDNAYVRVSHMFTTAVNKSVIM